MSYRKVGMWTFLALDLLLFGVLFGAYVAFRIAHPAAFAWSYRLLDRDLGLLNTAILLASSVTMAGAVGCARRSKRGGAVLLLGLTLLGGAGFLTVKAVEYTGKYKHGLLWGQRFRPDRRYLVERLKDAPPVAVTAASATSTPKPAASGDVLRGKPVFLGTCASCHGMEGAGIKSQGANLVASAFVGKLDDTALLAFVKKGRQPFDADSTMHLAMPAKGGNPILTDQNLLDTIAFIRSLRSAATTAAATNEAKHAAVEVAAATPVDPNAPRWVDGQWWLPKSVIPPAAEGPRGLRRARPLNPAAGTPPPDASLFFSLFYVMTGLHGLHVVAGMGLLVFLLVRFWRGRLGPASFTGLYWHAVDAIWFLLFPLFYLVV
jgi:cytochrome c oxidase subunit III